MTKCNGRYCANCCNRHYGRKLSEMESLENWICFKCSDLCVCAACRRLKSEDNYHITTRKRKSFGEKEGEESNPSLPSKIKRNTKNKINSKNIKAENNNKVILINETPSVVQAIKNPLDLLSEALMYEEEESTPSNQEPILYKNQFDNNLGHNIGSNNSSINHHFINNPNTSFNQDMFPHDGVTPIAINGLNHPNSINNLKLEIDFLSSEITKMKQDFINLQNIFETSFLGKK